MSIKDASKHLENITGRIRTAAGVLGLDDETIEILTTVRESWDGALAIKMDDGKLRQFQACRVWYRRPHNDFPYKGGFRYHPAVNVEMMKPHAVEMGLKSWVLNIPFGGGKGGVACNPEELSLGELKRLTEMLVDRLCERNMLGTIHDVPAPDVGTNSTITHWIRQRYAQNRKDTYEPHRGVVTGKPVGMGGIEGRTEATGYGVMAVLQHVCKELGHKQSDLRLAVMGFGNVGSHVVSRAAQLGHKIIAVSDVHGGIYNANGIDLGKLSEYNKIAKTIKGFPGGDAITNEELLVLQDVDVLVPAALEHVLTKKNAGHVRAKIVIEGANSPTMAEADKILDDNGVIVVPDILANAGGVTVSFFEWARNTSVGDDDRIPSGKREDVLRAMENMLVASTNEVLANAQKYKVNLRMAALITSLDRMAEKLRVKYTARKVS